MKSLSICNVPSDFKEKENYPILIYFSNSDKTALKKAQEEMFPRKTRFKKGYKVFYINTDSISEINSRLNWKSNAPGSYDSSTKILIKRNINYFRLGLLLFPKKTENLLNNFFIEKFEIPISSNQEKKGVLKTLKNFVLRKNKIAI